MKPPPFFEPIRHRASQRWNQLEEDKELAGPWLQLFKQVQSPRHVVSELLQNADDAGATEAAVRIEDGEFVFQHNGEDFTEEHFSSLCRFGFSNKRALHTIGFRGIGFKSTFSLGDTVRLRTPTLNVAFRRQRFTQPEWCSEPLEAPDLTEVAVTFASAELITAVRQNLQDWNQSPYSLLFFRNLRRLRLPAVDLHWRVCGPGPVNGSEWVALDGGSGERYLIVRSGDEEFPPDAAREIRDERLVDEEQLSLPPCNVTIVLGAEGRLYVVLPTGVQTGLPFACNAPFVQDPSRTGVKDPAQSATNRWLLERIGRLVSSTLLRWLEREDLTLPDRARAYDLLPPQPWGGDQVATVCHQEIAESALRGVRGSRCLLAIDGSMHLPTTCVILPRELPLIWDSSEELVLFDVAKRLPLAEAVSEAGRGRLAEWGFADVVTMKAVIQTLVDRSLPRPSSWEKLLLLWGYVEPVITGWEFKYQAQDIRIAPIQGSEQLHGLRSTQRLGEKRLLESDDDWQFLGRFLDVLDYNWPRFLAERRRQAQEDGDGRAGERVDAAIHILSDCHLSEAAKADDLLEDVAERFFAQPRVRKDCVRLAHIAAKLGVVAGDSFRFVVQGGQLAGKSDQVLVPDPAVTSLLTPSWTQAHALHQDYATLGDSCSEAEWWAWIDSGKAGVLRFPLPLTQTVSIQGRNRIAAEVERRGGPSELQFPYKTQNFGIEDWDFAPVHWLYWEILAERDATIWGKIVAALCRQRFQQLNRALSARVIQIATTGSRAALTQRPLVPSWILKSRALPCLKDTHGKYRRPDELLLRTRETEPLLDVEPFVDRYLDTEGLRPFLKLLGVRDAPPGPESVMERLVALSGVTAPPVAEVEKWYRRLDLLWESCSSTDRSEMRQRFQDQRLILTEEGVWVGAAGACVNANEDDVPGAAAVRSTVRNLALWERVGVAARPTVELALAWLRELPLGPLEPADQKRVRALLGRHPVRIWQECGRWLNLANEWVPSADLKYRLTMQSLIPYSDLYLEVRRGTADCRGLLAEVGAEPPFSSLPTLASRLEERSGRRPSVNGSGGRKDWLIQFGSDLMRLQLDDDGEAGRIHILGHQLREARWMVAKGLEVTPYLDGVPCGTPRRTAVVWRDREILVDDLPPARLARLIPESLARVLNLNGIDAALAYCYDRSANEVSAYMAQNFQLAEVDGATQPGLGVPGGLSGQSGPAPSPPGESSDSTAILSQDGVTGEDAAVAVLPQDSQEEALDQATTPGSETPKGGRTRSAPGQGEPPLIERYAAAAGFHPLGGDRYRNGDGSEIRKSEHPPFHWVHRSAAGELLMEYWVKEHCLQRTPLQLGADLWALLERTPEQTALILEALDGTPVQLKGSDLRSLKASGELELYPASYRIALREDSSVPL